jgi:hypothetical protein
MPQYVYTAFEGCSHVAVHTLDGEFRGYWSLNEVIKYLAMGVM